MKRKLHSLLTLSILLTGIIVSAFVFNSAEKLAGQWTNEDRTRVIEFVKVNDHFEALINAAPDKNLIGKKQIIDLQYEHNIYKGKLILPKRGETYPCTVLIIEENKIRITAKAGLVNKTQIWTRLK